MKRTAGLLLTLLSALASAQEKKTPAPKPQEVTKEITPNAGPHIAGEVDVFASAEFLWWKARDDGLGFALSGFASPVSSPDRGQTYQPNFRFEPGFRVSLGLGFSRDGWDICAKYTWNHSDKTRTSVRAVDIPSTTIAPYWFIIDQAGSPISQTDRLIYARGSWDLQFHVLDGELGRNFYISEFVTLRPFIGLKATWQEQEYRVAYDQVLPNLNFYRMDQQQDDWGIGIRAGVDSAWFFARKWCVFGNIALSALWDSFCIERRDLARASDEPEFVTTLLTRSDFHTIKPVSELSIGLRFQTYLNQNQYHLLFQAGWEEQVWWSKNQLIRIFEESAHGDLVFHGVSVKIRLDF